MTKHRKISVILSNTTLSRINKLQKDAGMSQNAVISRAVKAYATSEKKKSMRIKMAHGYQQMGEINLELANEAIVCDLRDYSEI